MKSGPVIIYARTYTEQGESDIEGSDFRSQISTKLHHLLHWGIS
jgi:hypothetical protein